jgi:dGTPase
MDWAKLLSKKRFNKISTSDKSDLRSEFHKDYDRIVFSSAFRRLGRKTQVHIPANVNTQSGHREHLVLPTHHEVGF